MGGLIDRKVLDVRRSQWPYQAGVGVGEAEVKVNTRYSGRILILQVHLRFEILLSQPPSLLPLTQYVGMGVIGFGHPPIAGAESIFIYIAELESVLDRGGARAHPLGREVCRTAKPYPRTPAAGRWPCH